MRSRSWAALLGAVVLMGCASSGGFKEPSYEGWIVSADSTRLTIENNRTRDGASPQFYFLGAGRHSLGTIEEMDGRLDRMVPVSWIGPDGGVTIVARYVGWRDFVFTKLYWRSGEVITVSLDNIFNPTAAWSH